MTELWRQASSEAPDVSVSTITWLGYDAPQNIVTDSPFEHYAYDGAPAYRQFMDGLDTSHRRTAASRIGRPSGTRTERRSSGPRRRPVICARTT